MPATHGKLANVFSLRRGGFKGAGLNDAVWGAGYVGPASAVFEVEIDSQGAADSFRWRQDGGAWTDSVAITGGAQELAEGQEITFAAVTGHTLGDRWTIGNLANEPCTASGRTARITDPDRRLVNPNAVVVFTDSGGARLLRVDHATGLAHFDANVDVVTAAGNDGFIPAAALERAGYLYEWSLETALDLAEATVFQEDWKRWQAGQAESTGSAAGFLAGRKWFDGYRESQAAYFLLQLFTHDPVNDQAGDHFNLWATFENFNLTAPLGELVKETVGFKGSGAPGLVLAV